MSQYNNELTKLKKLVSENVWEILEESNAIIAGGAITSVFCNREVNDVDVYFTTKDDMISFVRNVFDGRFSLLCLNIGQKSIMLRDKKTDQDVQLIVYKLFDDVEHIFNTFDFTVCMGAYDFKIEDFVLHKDFLKHNSQRYLKFHAGTQFPIVSALRTQKYLNKGYNISKSEYLRLMLTVNQLQISSWEELENHVGGMYGVDPSKLFDKTKEFSLINAVEQLGELESVLQDNKFQITDVSIDKHSAIEHLYELHGWTDDRESMEGRYFKNVCKESNGVLSSYYQKTFKYKLHELVNGGTNGIYVTEGDMPTTYSQSDSIIIELIPLKKELASVPAWGKDRQLVGDVFVKDMFTAKEFIAKFRVDL